ncbi:unknown [Anaerotruncus sp. CAG:390]|nr:unknown [Anaerotruncus sp. CAG:390]
MLAAIKNRLVFAVFDEYPAAAFGALHPLELALDLFVEFALRIVGAGIKAAVSAAAQHHGTAAKLALHARHRLGLCSLLGLKRSVGIERLRIAAVGVVRAGGKFAELAVSHDHRGAAFFAFDIGKLGLDRQFFVFETRLRRLKLA